MAKKRKLINVDFNKLEKRPYSSLNEVGKLIVDTIVDISQGKKDIIGRRCIEKPSDLQNAMLDMIDVAFKELTIRQQRVLTLAFGLNGREALTEREVAKKMAIAQPSVNELKSRAINALRKKTELNLKALKKISEK